MVKLSDDERTKLKAKIRIWAVDIKQFALDVFGFVATDQQGEVFEAYQKPGAKVIVKSGHGTGKSAVLSICTIWNVLFHPDCKVPCTAPTKSQLRDVMFAEIRKWLDKAHPYFKNQLACTSERLTVIGREAMQFAVARTARKEEPSALQGFHADNLAFHVDECFGVADTIYEVGRGAMTGSTARALLMGNPTVVTGFAYECFHVNEKFWSCHTLSSVDSPLVGENYVEEMKSEYGEDSDMYRVRVLGEFPRAAINQLIGTDLVDPALGRKIHAADYAFAPVILGVDPAWEGDDRSVVYMRQGLATWELGCWYDIDNMTLAGMVAQYWKEYNADACFIDMGWGSGVIDRLRQMGFSPIPVAFGGKSTTEECINKRMEMWLKMRNWLAEGGCLPNDSAMRTDLLGPTYAFAPSGKKQLEGKKTMKSRGMKSPDKGDALALTFAEEVHKLDIYDKFERKYDKSRAKMCVTEYDMFA